MAADAKSRAAAYVDRMKTTVWPLIQRYWFDAFVVAAAVGGTLEIAVGRDSADAPDLPLALSMAFEAGLTLILLARRRFPFGAPAGMLVAGTALSFVDGRLIPYSFLGFLAALAAAFLLGSLPERRQALLGLAITSAALVVIVGN